jgi:AcrR family transcriptional regulator
MSPAEIAVRERLLTAAIELIREHGPAGLTQPRVAKAAGISQSHLTYYFPTRAALLAAVLERAAEGQLAGMKHAFATVGRGPGKLAAALGAALEQPQNSRLLVSFALAADQDPQVRAIFESLARNMRAEIAAAMAKLDLPDDPQAVAMIHTIGTGLAVLNLALAGTSLQPNTAETIASLFKLLSK